MTRSALVLALALGACERASPADPAGLEAARQLVVDYYNLIGDGEYASASSLWGGEGPSAPTADNLEHVYGGVRDLRVVVERPVAFEAAEGWVTATVPVRITGRVGGERQQAYGDHSVRKAHALEGAEPWQRRWHVHSAPLAVR